jgi:hypothetical protein
MDPVTALGVAAACLQFIDFGLKTLHVCRELRDSGSLPENLDIERRTNTLQQLSKDLQKLTAATPSASEDRMRDLAAKCDLLSTELQNFMSKIKVNGKSITQAMKTTLRIIRDERSRSLRKPYLRIKIC